MQIVVKKVPLVYNAKKYPVGSVVDVSDKDGALLIKVGMADERLDAETPREPPAIDKPKRGRPRKARIEPAQTYTRRDMRAEG